jgi:hypothetical protein
MPAAMRDADKTVMSAIVHDSLLPSSRVDLMSSYSKMTANIYPKRAPLVIEAVKCTSKVDITYL